MTLANPQLNQLLVCLLHVSFSCAFWEHSITGICPPLLCVRCQ